MVYPAGHGIGEYVEALLSGLHQIPSRPYEIEILIAPDSAKDRLSAYSCRQVPISFLAKKEIFGLAKYMEGASLYHSPSFSSLARVPCDYLVTIHDLNHLLFGSIAQKLYYQFLLKPFLLRARQIVSISTFSQGELNNWLGEREIPIVQNPVGAEYTPTANDTSFLRAMGLTENRYFLSLAGEKEHKNLKYLLDIYRQYREIKEDALPMVVVPQVNQPGVVSLGQLSPQQKNMFLYYAAVCFVPSQYEGFGRVPIEAIQLGTPVVASNIAPHKDSLMQCQAAQLLSLADEQAWVQAMVGAHEGQKEHPEESEVQRLKQRFDSLAIAKIMHQIYLTHL